MNGAMIGSHIQNILECTSIEAVWALHVKNMTEFGFDRMLYASSRFRNYGEYGDVKDALILSNHHPDYVKVFVEKGLFEDAPMVRWVAHNTGASSWSIVRERIEKQDLTGPEMEVLQLNSDYGISAGYSISFKEIAERFRGGIGLCAALDISQDDVEMIWAEHGETLITINNLVHLKISSLPHTGGRRPLSTRQREVLQWVADGKSIQDTATIMGLTAPTVEKHLRLARKNLNVDTTAQAVLKATMQNQFFAYEGNPGA
jgi:DNA-binding CsgD family transcriptional regulator